MQKKSKTLLENKGLEYDYEVISGSSEYSYQLIFGRYKKRENALKMQNQIAKYVDETVITKNAKDYWVLSSAPMSSRQRVDLLKIKLNHLRISPQVIKRKIAQ